MNRELSRHAKGPIPEADFPRPGEDVTSGDKKGNLSAQQTGGVSPARGTLVVQMIQTEKPPEFPQMALFWLGMRESNSHK